MKIYAETGFPVGDYDLNKKVYTTIRDNAKNHIFWKKEFGNAVGLSKNIARHLIKIEQGLGNDMADDIMKRITLRFMLLHYEAETVIYEISLFDFMAHSADTFFSGKENADQQYRCALKHFHKVDFMQKKLEEVIIKGE